MHGIDWKANLPRYFERGIPEKVSTLVSPLIQPPDSWLSTASNPYICMALACFYIYCYYKDEKCANTPITTAYRYPLKLAADYCSVLRKILWKGHWHKIFCTRSFKSKLVPQPPDSYPEALSNINLPRYSTSKQIPRCGPPAPPEDLILRCGPPRGIWSPGVAPPAGLLRWTCIWGKSHGVAPPPRGIKSWGVAPPGGSDPTMWPPLGNQTFHCGPRRGIDSHTAGSFEYSLRA